MAYKQISPQIVAEGGTGAITLTDHGVLLGSGTSAITAAAVGATGEILIGNTGADPSFSATPTVTTMNATTFDTNVAAAGVTLAGTTLEADGSDANISITLTPKGTGDISITASSIVPTTDRADSLGSATNSWDNVYADGITFDDGTNIMSTYTTGTWTPTIVGLSAAGVSTYTVQTGRYIKIGRMVTIHCDVAISAATGTGTLTIQGLPYSPDTQAATSAVYFDGSGWAWPANITNICAYVPADGKVRISGTGSSTAAANIQMTNASLEVIFSITFRTAS